MTAPIPKGATAAVALVVAVLIGWSYHALTGHRRIGAFARPDGFHVDSTNAQESTNPQELLVDADRFYWSNNGPAAAPLYARAEKLFAQEGDARNELHAKIGRLRSEAETMSFVDLSRFLGEQLQGPIVKDDKDLRLWCLIAKGYTDIEIDYRAAKRDWLEAQEIAKSLGENQWVTRASGELGLIAFLEGNPGRAARLLGGALLSTMASGDVGGQVRFLEMLGRGFEEVNRHAEALRFGRSSYFGILGLQMPSGIPGTHQPRISAYPKKDRSAWHWVARLRRDQPSSRLLATNSSM